METRAMFGAGCFWGVEEVFRVFPGVVKTRVGFSGGTVKDPSYAKVCEGNTGHAEVVEIIYDPGQTTYEKLLDRFFEIHDPTQVNRQGPDVGDQYRSVIFYYTAEQKESAEKSKDTLAASGKWHNPIATEIAPAGEFYEAEEYHQHYFLKNGGGTCHV
ncbi:MAG: peptide-methionine (S)-S-oxide reductase MsrA [Patescibacteria group bacterium]